ncbi:hypothetical protein FB451DRAFT_1466441 [Mycena latifolia]|nr:hypothetical protein FB451DRAFT_1466441 [Mycena latifolia]
MERQESTSMAPVLYVIRIYGLACTLSIAWSTRTQPFTAAASYITACATFGHTFGHLIGDLRLAIVAAKADNDTPVALEEGKALPDGQAQIEVVETPPPVMRTIALLVLLTTLWAVDMWMRATKLPVGTNAGGAGLLSGLEVLFSLVALIKLFRLDSAANRWSGEPETIADLGGRNDVATTKQPYAKEKSQGREESDQNI